ncbi:MAG TPA: hypothetical protein H9717_02605 [Candidatus Eisenbergiella merdipullorum]|uniref:Uncharacterized protein n=1 Tax=Candidatus Eisenbergiella merdipullorum TaxID=2838553 RepID=A0A9D2I522_9FIRM|nr:hypothetical protein [Candidatus Eisenbergiella merdipullorum]
MFGYVIVNKQELKFREFDLYQSYYCGFCRKLKEKYGIRGQLTLSYDMTFLILLLSGLYEEEDVVSSCKCIAHPLERHATRTNRFTEYAADMNVILSYYHCMDDWNDEKKVLKRGYAGLLKKACAGAESRYPEKARLIKEELLQLQKYEKAGSQDLDTVAGCFGNIMAEIFACRKDEWEDELRIMGFFLGKFIYLLDAYEDMEKDEKNGCYNPFSSRKKEKGFDDEVLKILRMMMAECSRAFEKLPILENTDILRNILYSGVWCRFESVRARRKEQQENA